MDRYDLIDTAGWFEDRATANDMNGEEICADCHHDHSHHVDHRLTPMPCDEEETLPGDGTETRLCGCEHFQLRQEDKRCQS